ncbi:MAG: hypothetical protein KC505_06030 [Myxococcales bacterium]|nr:hypothetical protein [Myxococcales bacterium]USN50858.1 MAG: hypothetical protein H6731_00090 [Myxococcales bacterium]
MNPIIAFAPFLSVSAAIVLTIGAYIARWSPRIILAMLAILLGLAWYSGFVATQTNINIWGISLDALGTFGFQLVLPSLFTITVMSFNNSHADKNIGSLLLILLSGVGAISVLISHNWMILFVAIQCMSIPIYALISRDHKNPYAISSSMRYLLLSAIAMSFMLFGILLFYADTQSFDFYAQAIRWRLDGISPLSLFGIAFVLIGIAFKLSIFPFHIWAPQVYQGAPFFTVALMIVVSKSAVLLTFLRISLIYFDQSNSVSITLSAMAIVSLWLGSGLMIIEKNFLRFLAFLSISHMGFLFIAVMSQSIAGIEAVLLDLCAFSLGIFLVLLTLNSLPCRSSHIKNEDLKGLYFRCPLHSIALLIGFFSITGFPLTAGFIGKFSIFSASIKANLWMFLPHMVAASVLTFIAFIRLSLIMFQPVTEDQSLEKIPFSSIAIIAALLTITLGIYPDPLIAWVKTYSSQLGILR